MNYQYAPEVLIKDRDSNLEVLLENAHRLRSVPEVPENSQVFGAVNSTSNDVSELHSIPQAVPVK